MPSQAKARLGISVRARSEIADRPQAADTRQPCQTIGSGSKRSTDKLRREWEQESIANTKTTAKIHPGAREFEEPQRIESTSFPYPKRSHSVNHQCLRQSTHSPFHLATLQSGISAPGHAATQTARFDRRIRIRRHKKRSTPASLWLPQLS